MKAAYLQLHEQGELATRAAVALELLEACQLCPRRCGSDRLAGDKGWCGTGLMARVASYEPHFGEETSISGVAGSGTIFFSHCNLGCVFCQNQQISQGQVGIEVDTGQLAAMMLSLQKQGCHNINLVTPSHVIPQILRAVDHAAGRGLTLPLVYNSSGYDTVAGLALFDGVVDIYMPDFKFWQPASAGRYCQAEDYPEVARQAIVEMFRQVGDLQFDNNGLASRGLLVRHLLMPGMLAESRDILSFLAGISAATFVNIMAQYRPCYKADAFPEIDRDVDVGDYEAAFAWAGEVGLTRLEQGGLERLLALLDESRGA